LLWDKANVLHHVVDNIVNILRECEEKDIPFQPGLLLRQLDARFKSPLLQSIITGLEGFSNDDIDYSHGYQYSTEIICYDFKEQAWDLIQDIDLWGNFG